MHTTGTLRVRSLGALMCAVVAWACQPGAEHNAEETRQAQQALTCRTVELDASKSYGPSTWVDDTETLAPSMRFALPSEVPVIAGNSGNHWITFRYRLAGVEASCRYKGDSSQAHPVGRASAAGSSLRVLELHLGRHRRQRGRG